MKKGILIALVLGHIQVTKGQEVPADWVKLDSLPPTPSTPVAEKGFGFVFSKGNGGLFHRMLSGTDKLLKDSRTLTISGTSNEISSSPSTAQNLSADRTWTLSLPATIDLGGKTSFELPNGFAPETNTSGEIAADNDAWPTPGSPKGAVQFYDGSSPTYLVGTLANDSPTNKQFPQFQSGGTITWESLSATDIPSTLNATTFSGKLQFSGTGHVGLDVNSLNNSQETGLDNGNLWYNSQSHKYRGYRNGSKRDFIMSGDGLGVNFQADEIILGAIANDSIRSVPKQNFGRLVSSTIGEATWLTPSSGWRIDEDWINSNVAGNNRWANFNSANGTINIDNTSVDGNHPGIVRFLVPSTGDYAGLHLGTAVMHFGGGIVVFEALIKIQALSTTTNEYDIYVGFGDNVTSGDHADGVYFLYDGNGLTNWIMATANQGTCPTNCTKTDSGQPVATGWVKLRIEVTSGSSASFYVNGTFGGTVPTNIPTSYLRVSGPNVKIVRNSPTATSGTFDIDYVAVQQLFTTAR